MQTSLQILMLASVASIAGGVFFLALELRHLRMFLQSGQLQVHRRRRPSSGSNRPYPRPNEAGYAIYVARNGRWVLESDLSQPGFEAFAPEMAPGYEQQCIRKESVLKRPS